MEPRETAATAFRGLAVAYKQTPKANAIISQAVTPFHGALNIFLLNTRGFAAARLHPALYAVAPFTRGF